MSASKLHQELLATLTELARVEKRAVLLFAEIAEGRLYRDLGYSSMLQYAREALKISDAKFNQFQRLAESFKTLPEVKSAVASGALSWTKARVVARVAKPETQKAWIEEAKKSGRRELERKAKAARSQMTDAPEPGLFLEERPALGARQDLSILLKLRPEQLAQFEVLMEALRKQGLKGSRAEVLLQALALSAEGDCTRVQSRPKQVVIYQCEDCGETKVQTSRGLLETEAPTDDAKVLGKDGVNRSSIPPKMRNQVLARDRHRCQSPGCGNTRFLELHHIEPRAKGGDNTPENLITLCSACHRLAHDCTRVQSRSADSGIQPLPSDPQ
jgi:hypothetical protein